MEDKRTFWLEILVVLAISSFLFYFGLDSFGLLGADEPRYAQIAREMMERHNWITPHLYGEPWLEKPVLYYWRAIAAYEVFGVHDWTARLPSAVFASLMIVMVYLHMRRFRPGAQVDAALITAGCAAVLGFARGASTDMGLAAPFVIGMLGWYAWYETGKKIWLIDFYFFVALGMLAKGPVSPFLAAAIVLAFVIFQRDWKALLRTLWIPGILLFLVTALPWYILVQLENPEFFRVFILEHNLQRFGKDVYSHVQPFWYYIPVTLISLAPWTVLGIAALSDGVRDGIRQWKHRDRALSRTEDSFPEFLVIWALVIVGFFSLSHSKLPGYILPAIPPITILIADYLRRRGERGLKAWIVAGHAIFTGLLAGGLLLAPQLLASVGPIPQQVIGMAAAVALMTATGLWLISRHADPWTIRYVTLIPVLTLVFYLATAGAPYIDAADSLRPVARELSKPEVNELPVAVLDVRRQVEYGLAWYRNSKIPRYERGEVPPEEHVVVVKQESVGDLRKYIGERAATRIGGFPGQRVEYFLIATR